MNICICTIKSWNIRMARVFNDIYKGRHNIKIISEKEQLNYKFLSENKVDYIFFPHWSFLIPKEIFNNFECIVFHMTDLPFGRGGSPLQNLIVRGIEETQISAIKVTQQLDAGPIYLKTNLSLHGTAEEILIRASTIIFNEMIPKILEEKMIPVEQSGDIVHFKRRSEKESEIEPNTSLEKIYDYIRMLDAEGYPNAFIKYGDYKLTFKNAILKDGKLFADVRMERDSDNEENIGHSGPPR